MPGVSKIFQDRSRDRKKGFERHIRFLVFGSFLIGTTNLTFRPKTPLKNFTRFFLKHRWTTARSLASHDSFLAMNRIIRVFLASRDTPDTWSTLDLPGVPLDPSQGLPKRWNYRENCHERGQIALWGSRMVNQVSGVSLEPKGYQLFGFRQIQIQNQKLELEFEISFSKPVRYNGAFLA